MERLVGAYIELARIPVSKEEVDRKSVAFPSEIIDHVHSLDCIPITSVELDPDPRSDYGHVPTFHKFFPAIELVGEFDISG